MSSIVPDGWKLSPLGDIASVNWGNTSLTKNNYTEIGFPAFSAAGNDGLVSNAENTTTGVVLSAIGARCGRTFLTPQKWTAIKNTITILTDDQDIRFLYQVFNFDEVWNKSGGAQPYLTRRCKKDPNIASTPPEQKKIASILTSVDEVIENTQKQIDKLQDLKKATMNELLTKGIGHTEFKDSEFGRIPKSWEVGSLGEISTRITDGTHQAVKTSDNGTIPFLYVSTVRDQEINWGIAGKITEDEYSKASQGRQPNLGDILYTAVGSYGYAAIVDTDSKFCFQRHIALIQLNQELVSPKFIENFLVSDTAKRQADRLVVGNAQLTLTLG